MAQVKAEYEILEDYSTIAKKIIEKHPEVFGELDSTKIRGVLITNKDKSEVNDSLYSIVPVKPPITLDCQYGWYVVMYMSDWVNWSEVQQKFVVMKSLFSIPKDGDGPVNLPDYKDFSPILRTFGVDPFENENLPDVLEDHIEWSF